MENLAKLSEHIDGLFSLYDKEMAELLTMVSKGGGWW